ncbi:MAG: hypothetical protein ACFCUP_02480 [Actinomycetales bacterium]
MSGRTAVGMCVTPRDAVLAVVVREGRACSVTAIADLTWPAGLWSWPGPERDAARVAGRLLGTARRGLGLPRWCDVMVTGAPDGADGLGVTGRTAGLLARAGLTLAGAVTVDEARAWWDGGSVDVPPELRARAAGPGALAIGAALGLVPGVGVAEVDDTGQVAEDGGPDGSLGAADAGGRGGLDDQVDLADGEGGWIVEYVGEITADA